MTLVEFPLDNDQVVVVEVSDEARDRAGAPVFRGGISDNITERAGETLQAALSRTTPAAQAVIDAMTDLASRPDEIAVTFGLELSGSLGAFIASTAAKANFAVTLTWKHVTDP
jgi:Trypsin-co-occurring domain 1